jgi:hypothetical protein
MSGHITSADRQLCTRWSPVALSFRLRSEGSGPHGDKWVVLLLTDVFHERYGDEVYDVIVTFS